MPSTEPELRILVVGCGSVGERHMWALRQIPGVAPVPCDLDDEKLKRMWQEYQVVEGYHSLEEAPLITFDAAFICTPTHTHLELAHRVVEQERHVFIEKPISTTVDGVDELAALAQRKRLVLQVGYVLRHHPCLKQIKSWLDAGQIGQVLGGSMDLGYHLPTYRPDYQSLHSAEESTGGGVLLDATHQLDYIQWLIGPVLGVGCLARHTGTIAVAPEVEDLAVLVLEFQNGALVDAHLNNIQHGYQSSCTLVGTEGTITWDYVRAETSLYHPSERRWERHALDLESDELFLLQAQAFVDLIRGKPAVQVTAQEAKQALAVALAAKESSRTRVLVEVHGAAQ